MERALTIHRSAAALATGKGRLERSAFSGAMSFAPAEQGGVPEFPGHVADVREEPTRMHSGRTQRRAIASVCSLFGRLRPHTRRARTHTQSTHSFDEASNLRWWIT